MDIKFCNFAIISLVIATGILSGGCGDVVNTKKIPGHKYANVLNQLPTTNKPDEKQEKTGVVKTKSGVYIYKDKSVINTTGRDFAERSNYNVGPRDVIFEAEKSHLRY